MAKGLFIFIGESFRYGKQNTRIRGGQKSYTPQMDACASHIQLLNRVKGLGIDPFAVIASYTTPFDSDLCTVYKPFLHSTILLNQPCGLTYLFRRTLDLILDIDTFDFVMYIRIDIHLTETCIKLFDPFKSKILFPNLLPSNTEHGYPNVNDMFAYIPKQYLPSFRQIVIYHTMLQDLTLHHHITHNDVEYMINTYHDSDTAKDINPLYTIVNRPKATVPQERSVTITSSNIFAASS